MKVLRSNVISAVRSGTYQYAKVESISGGRATVRLGNSGTGSRLTNLYVAGYIEVGYLVIVDYSVDRPYVRSAQQVAATAMELDVAEIPLDEEL